MSELVRLCGLSSGYGRQDIVQNIGFSVPEGSLCALLGANGSGKSTLLRAMVGLLPYRGSCLLEGEELRDIPHRRQAGAIGYLAQRSGPPLSLTALDVVLMGFNPVLGPFRAPSAAQRARALDVMAQVEAAPFAQKDYGCLSEGQRQLVLLARTLVRDTRLIALDEPDSALDFVNRHRVMALLQARARQTGCAVLMSSHDANFALGYADRLLLLQSGRLVHHIDLTATTQEALAAALGDIYGPTQVLRHNGRYVML